MTNEIFAKYSKYYDLLYKEKEYEKEVEFILQMANINSVKVSKILDMGCGSGSHIECLLNKGMTVTGFDLSPQMIEIALAKMQQRKDKVPPKLSVGDIRNYRDSEKYDLVVSMFAVMGYLISNEDIIAGLKTARIHLKEGGLFVFDVWYGPTVLHEKPETRIHEYSLNNGKIYKLVRPVLDVNSDVVEVNYNIIEYHESQIVADVFESHKMRYYFRRELELLLNLSGFELLNIYPNFDNMNEPKLGDWNINVVAKAKSEE